MGRADAPFPPRSRRSMPHASGPPPADAGEVTALLLQLRGGDDDALPRLLPLVYDELRRTAARAIARERAGHTLQATDVVHEAFFRLAGGGGILASHDRVHLLAIAARAMRQVLVEHARRRGAGKRGGGAVHVTLGGAHDAPVVADDELLALDEALDRLDAVSPRLRALVEYRFFAGLTERETAEALGVGERTVQRDWVRARAWLHAQLQPGGDGP